MYTLRYQNPNIVRTYGSGLATLNYNRIFGLQNFFKVS